MTHPPPAEDAPPTRADALRSTLWAAAGSLARYALAGITTLVLARLLAPADFGLVALTAAAHELIAHVAPVGLHDALIQRPRLNRAALDSAWWSTLAVAGALTLGVIALAAPIAGVFEQPALAALLAAVALAAFVRALSMPARAVLARRLDFRTPTLIRVVGMVLGGAVAIALAAFGAGPWSLVAHTAVINVTSALLITRVAGWRPGRPDRAALIELWKFAASVSAFTVLAYLTANADDQLIGYRLGAQALGYYALAFSVMAWPVRDVLGGVAVVFYPVMARFQSDPARLRAIVLEGLQLTSLFAFPALALIALGAPGFVPWLLGERWTPIVLTAQILALGGLREATMMLNGVVYRAVGRPHLHLMLALASTPCYLVAFVVGLRWGIEGVAFFYVLTGWLLHPVSWWLLNRTIALPLRGWLAALVPAAGGTVLASVVGALAFRSLDAIPALADGPALVLSGLAGGAAYALALLIWRPPALWRSAGALGRLVRQPFARL